MMTKSPFVCSWLALLILVGCARSNSVPDRVTWRLVQKQADSVGKERFTVQVADKDPHLEGESIVIPGMVTREVLVDIWNVYECKEERKGRLGDWKERKRIVVDPIDKPVRGTDPELKPASIPNDLRQPIGMQWEPADYGSGPRTQVIWEIPALRSGNRTSSGKVSTDSAGGFRLQLSREALRGAAQLPEATIKIILSLTGPQESPTREFRTRELQIERSMFVEAALNGR